MLGKTIAKLSDEDLFLRYKSNANEECFRELYRRYSGKIYAYCLRAAVDKESARDVFQKSWAAIIENKSKFGGGSFIAWLMIITRNNCLMAKRQHKYSTELDGDQSYLIENEQADFEMKRLMHQQIEKLPNDLSEIIKLRYFEDFTYSEISEILDINLSLVKVRLFRAKKLLAQSLSFLKDD